MEKNCDGSRLTASGSSSSTCRLAGAKERLCINGGRCCTRHPWLRLGLDTGLCVMISMHRLNETVNINY